MRLSEEDRGSEGSDSDEGPEARARRPQGRGGREDRKGAKTARARPGAQSSAPPRSSSSRPAVMMPEGRATTATPMSEEIMAMVRPTSEEG